MDPERVAFWYKSGMWSKPMVKMAVRKGTITKAQYKEITGEDY